VVCKNCRVIGQSIALSGIKVCRIIGFLKGKYQRFGYSYQIANDARLGEGEY